MTQADDPTMTGAAPSRARGHAAEDQGTGNREQGTDQGVANSPSTPTSSTSPRDAPTMDGPTDPQPAAARYAIIGEWLVEETGECTCGPGPNAYGHERGCGLDPIHKVAELLANYRAISAHSNERDATVQHVRTLIETARLAQEATDTDWDVSGWALLEALEGM